jgi:hypothetical protein
MTRVIDTHPPEDFPPLLARFRGLACDYEFFKLDGADTAPPTVEDLRTVVRRTIERYTEQTIAARKKSQTAAIKSWLWLDPARLNAAVPREINWNEFLGPQWPEPEPWSDSDDARRSYAGAFADTPHGIELLKLLEQPRPWWRDFVFGRRPNPPLNKDKDEQEFNRLMAAVLESAVGAEIGSERVRIWQWPTDWSGYFDAGHEWWGSCCWTLWTQPDRVLGIVASTTD